MNNNDPNMLIYILASDEIPAKLSHTGTSGLTFPQP